MIIASYRESLEIERAPTQILRILFFVYIRDDRSDYTFKIKDHELEIAIRPNRVISVLVDLVAIGGISMSNS